VALSGTSKELMIYTKESYNMHIIHRARHEWSSSYLFNCRLEPRVASPIVGIWPFNNISRIQVIYWSKASPINMNVWNSKRSEPTNNKSPRPINISIQSSVGVKLCCCFCQPEHIEPKCWVIVILLSLMANFYWS
jgi:hypothetical protein